MKIPVGVTNEALWRKHCRKIRARALGMLEGRLGVIATARAMLPFAHWTKVEMSGRAGLSTAIGSVVFGQK